MLDVNMSLFFSSFLRQHLFSRGLLSTSSRYKYVTVVCVCVLVLFEICKDTKTILVNLCLF